MECSRRSSFQRIRVREGNLSQSQKSGSTSVMLHPSTSVIARPPLLAVSWRYTLLPLDLFSKQKASWSAAGGSTASVRSWRRVDRNPSSAVTSTLLLWTTTVGNDPPAQAQRQFFASRVLISRPRTTSRPRK